MVAGAAGFGGLFAIYSYIGKIVPDVAGPVHVLLDGPVVEISTGTALVGLGVVGR